MPTVGARVGADWHPHLCHAENRGFSEAAIFGPAADPLAKMPNLAILKIAKFGQKA